MSGRITGLALDNFHTGGSVKLVLLALAEHAGGDGQCFPSYHQIANRACCSKATVARALRSLEKGGWIQRRQRSNSTTIFRLNVVRLEALDAERRRVAKLELVPDWPLFPEEEAAQPIENNPEPHNEATEPHSYDTTPCHSYEVVTTTEPSPKGQADQPPNGGGWPALNRTQLRLLRQDQSFVIREGEALRKIVAGTAEHKAFKTADRQGRFA